MVALYVFSVKTYFCYIVNCWFMQNYTYICWIHTDAMINADAMIMTDAGRLLYKYIPLTLFVRIQKGCSGFVCERVLETEHNWNIWTPKLWSATLCLSRSPLDPNSISGPESPFGRVWLSLPHLSSTGTRTLLATPLARRTQLNYIIVRHPLDLWNRMFNRHQAEITVMQFRGHSLPVRQSMRLSWDFFTSSHFISQFPPTRFPLISAIRMCHFLPVHHIE